MRQLFSSPRLENVEAVDKLLTDAGIQTRLTDAKTWNRATKRDFSYTDRSGSYRWPAVWVLKAEDYSRARALLNEAGVAMPGTRNRDASSYLPTPPVAAAPAERRTPMATKVRYVLWLGVAVSAIVYALRALGFL